MNLTESKALLGGRSSRRSFLRKAFGIGAGAAALPAALSLGARSAKADDAASLAQDLEVLTLALNLEYLEAEYYTYAQTGKGIETQGVGISGKTAPGTTTVKANSEVPFESDAIRDYAAEIAEDERHHVNAIRELFASVGATPPSRPDIDLLNSFNTAAKAAGIADTFDPFANETNFLIGSFIFEDVGVTAYRGGAPLITSSTFLSAAAGILAVEAIHAAVVRTNLFVEGGNYGVTQKISDLRDSLDGGGNTDQGLGDVYGRGIPNIVPTNNQAIVYSRTARQVLNIVYGAVDAEKGLFFPNGINQ